MRSSRFLIAGLIWILLLTVIALARLADPSTYWPGTLSLLTRGMACLALVGAICRTGAVRACWLGFASFGWAYVILSSTSWFDKPTLPTHALMTMLGSLVGIPLKGTHPATYQRFLVSMFFLIGDSLWFFLAGMAGGFVARFFFGKAMPTSTEATGAGAQCLPDASHPNWGLLFLVMLLGPALFASIAFAGARLEPMIWAGATYVLTWCLLGLAALAALCARSRRREFWLGAAFFGIGFLFLVFSRRPYESRVPDLRIPSAELLEAVRPQFEMLVRDLSGDPNSVAATTARIRKALRKRIRARLPEKMTLEGFVQYVREITRGPQGEVITIHVDPIGLLEAEKSMTSTVNAVNLEGATLHTALARCLEQLELAYLVEDDMLLITSRRTVELSATWPNEDPYLIVGHCILALISAGVGGVAAPLVCILVGERGESRTGA